MTVPPSGQGTPGTTDTAARRAFCATLWDGMLALYGVPEVPPLCLRLQDGAGADVPLLLVLVLADHAGLGANASQGRALIRNTAFWRDTVVVPIRSVRRALKGQTDTADQAFRDHLKHLELAAERRHVARISAAFGHLSGTGRLAPLYLAELGLADAEIKAALSVLADACATLPESASSNCNTDKK